MATHYAFTDPKEWSKMTGHQRWGSPFFYGALFAGIDSKIDYDNIGGQIERKLFQSALRIGVYSLVFGAEYGSMTFSKGYYEEFTDAKKGKWRKKAGIVGWKSLFYGLPLQ